MSNKFTGDTRGWASLPRTQQTSTPAWNEVKQDEVWHPQVSACSDLWLQPSHSCPTCWHEFVAAHMVATQQNTWFAQAQILMKVMKAQLAETVLQFGGKEKEKRTGEYLMWHLKTENHLEAANQHGHLLPLFFVCSCIFNFGRPSFIKNVFHTKERRKAALFVIQQFDSLL